MNTDKDIKYFEAIEKLDFSKENNKALLKSISTMDKVLHENSMEEVSINFTQHLITDLLKLKSAPSNYKIIRTLAFIFIPIIIIFLAIAYLSTGTIENSILITQNLNAFYSALQFTSDPKVQQLFLIGEGIILLVIIEKIASSYKIYKYSSQS